MKWQNSLGAVVVMRKDKKPLLPEHVEALAEFQHRLIASFQEQTESSFSDIESGVQRSKA
jgi:hypothetical protein